MQAHRCVKIRTDVQRALYNLYVRVAVWVHVCTHTHMLEHKPYPERDKSNPLLGGTQGSSIDGTLSGC